LFGHHCPGTEQRRAVSIPRAAPRLLQSRVCEQETAAGHAAVETLAKRFHVSGTVQGVGFRFFAERVASRLNVSGYVKNLFDGRVEVYAIGTEDQMVELKQELQRGPRMSRVEDVAETDAEILEEFLKGFGIEREY
jgi:acylphosphatase